MQGVEDQDLRKRIERLERLLAVAFGSGGGSGGDLPLNGDVTGPEAANTLAKIAALAGGGTRAVEVDNAGNVIAGTAGGPSTVLWRPGGVSAGNVYATWAEVVAAVATMQGIITIGVDVALAAAVIPTGNWDLRPVGVNGQVTLVSATKSTLATTIVTLTGAVTLKGLNGLDAIQLINNSTLDVMTTSAADSFEFSMRGQAILWQGVAAAGKGFFVIPAGSELSLIIDDNSRISTFDGGSLAVQRTGGSLFITMTSAALLDTNQLSGAAATVHASPGTTYGVQPAAPNVFPIGYREKGSTAIAPGTGKTAAISAFINANSRILVSLKTPVGDALTIKYAALGVDRANGSQGTFQISALVAAGGGATNGADTSTIDWEVIN